jgi:TPR repeat protein
MVMQYIEELKNIKDIELYALVFLVLFTMWFIYNTVNYYYARKRKIKNLHYFAKYGNAEAQSDLAKHYQKGEDVVKNPRKAAFWYQKASFSGDKDAKTFLEKLLNR